MSRRTVLEAARAFWAQRKWRHPGGLPIYVDLPIGDDYCFNEEVCLEVFFLDIAVLNASGTVLKIWLEIGGWPPPRMRRLRFFARYLNTVLRLGAEKYPVLREYKVIVPADPLYRKRLVLVKGSSAWAPWSADIPLHGGDPRITPSVEGTRVLVLSEPLPLEPGWHQSDLGSIFVFKCSGGMKIALVATSDGVLYSCKPATPARRTCPSLDWSNVKWFVKYECPDADRGLLAALEMLSP